MDRLETDATATPGKLAIPLPTIQITTLSAVRCSAASVLLAVWAATGPYCAASWRVTMGTYPASIPGGGTTTRPGSTSASFPTVGAGRYS